MALSSWRERPIPPAGRGEPGEAGDEGEGGDAGEAGGAGGASAMRSSSVREDAKTDGSSLLIDTF